MLADEIPQGLMGLEGSGKLIKNSSSSGVGAGGNVLICQRQVLTGKGGERCYADGQKGRLFILFLTRPNTSD
jgi:hypothetical protein